MKVNIAYQIYLYYINFGFFGFNLINVVITKLKPLKINRTEKPNWVWFGSVLVSVWICSPSGAAVAPLVTFTQFFHKKFFSNALD